MAATRHVLVVDDDEGVREILECVLHDAGYRVTSAASGPSMCDLLESADPVDLVVLEPHMRGEDYVFLTDELTRRQMPLVLVSGSPMMLDRAARRRFPVVVKPFKAADLTDAITEALDRAVPRRA
ncbi:MAG: two component transcriptional regulator, winged helix family [Rhodospirillales bacterium]|jgi:CheY-like chemotaxis protein|nr:two component transcriptional regulator, winged helix family [Rhodospirillales bacterium]